MVVERDTGYAPDRWAFDAEVTRVFEDMLQRSIPEYQTMRAAVVGLLRARFLNAAYVRLLDLGCSRGGMIEAVRTDKHIGAKTAATGIETSQPMLDAARQRFTGQPIDIVDADLRNGLPKLNGEYEAVTSILTIMFVPMEYRARLIADIYNVLRPGGVFIWVEKIIGGVGIVDQLLTDNYYQFKEASGYTKEEITRKRLALEGVLVPQTEAANQMLLAAAGFYGIECFWRWMNFAGWIAFKGGAFR